MSLIGKSINNRLLNIYHAQFKRLDRIKYYSLTLLGNFVLECKSVITLDLIKMNNKFELPIYGAKTPVLFVMLLLVMVQSVSFAQTAKFAEQLVSPELLDRVRHEGGFVLYMRHGATDNSRPDQVPSIDLNDCNTQRMLSDEGRDQIKLVGTYVRQANIPHDKPISSPLCRAKESAQIAFGDTITDERLGYSGSLSSTQKIPIIAGTRQLLSQMVEKGRNRLLVAHAPNLMDTMGYFPKEGTIVIIQPEGEGKFSYLGSIPPNHWHLLLEK
jgi:phosphohistidine phosphatase SixA